MRSAAAALIAACSLIGCEPEPQAFRGATMGTTYSVKYVGADPVDVVRGEVEAVLAEVNLLFSTYDEASEISQFNARATSEGFPVSPKFRELLDLALDVAGGTSGAFDPTMLPLVDLYGFGPSAQRRIPSDEEISSVLERVGYEQLEFVDGGGLVAGHPDLQLDLSAIAKGWGVDRVCGALDRRGIESYMVEIGGEVRCAGLKRAGQPWMIGIEGPGESPGLELVDKVALRDMALATSGSYRNFVRVEAVSAHHILDPRTGKNPDNRVVSVSVRAPSCALADALATALMVTGPDGAADVLGRYEGASALFLVARGVREVRAREVGWR